MIAAMINMVLVSTMLVEGVGDVDELVGILVVVLDVVLDDVVVLVDIVVFISSLQLW